ncbi:MAG TPA: hypothetical protein VML94_02145 [Thermoplasmata archaeon]|nr:hypothetical protein [Thermoplasmata archaeon]
MRLLVRPRAPLLMLLLLAPAIPELLTGSTPITGLAYDPVRFGVDFAFEIGLYGCGAVLVREFAVVLRKGWASILLLGAAYGIVEEGFAVHTIFQTSGAPVNALATYGHAFGVNWLWAVGIVAFHATYSIALPILLVRLWYPDVARARWFDASALTAVAAVFLGTVAVFSTHEGYPPRPGALAGFLLLVGGLVALAWRAPAALLSVKPGVGRAGPLGLVLVGTLGFLGWLMTLALAAGRWVSAWVAAALLVLVNLGAVVYVTARVGEVDLERSEFWFATGMLLALWVWDIPIEFGVPGILAVTVVFVYLQYRLGERIRARSATVRSNIPPVATGAPPLG